MSPGVEFGTSRSKGCPLLAAVSLMFVEFTEVHYNCNQRWLARGGGGGLLPPKQKFEAGAHPHFVAKKHFTDEFDITCEMATSEHTFSALR